jgi:DNA-binding PadR family transcriptional regulator
MRIGNNEKIVLSLMKKYKKYDEKELHVLFLYAAQKKARVDVILHSLRIKGILNKKNRPDVSFIEDTELPSMVVPKEILDNLEHLAHTIKIGNLAKSILYVLFKTEKCSLQLISMLFKEPVKNIYAILQRLEEKNFVTSYHSRIKHVDVNGRKYNPKYYLLTDLGKTRMLVYGNKELDVNNINKALEKLDGERKRLVSKF